MLEKTKVLKKVEFIFTDDKLHPVCKCEYNLEIHEDGSSLMGMKHVEESDAIETRNMVSNAELYQEGA